MSKNNTRKINKCIGNCVGNEETVLHPLSMFIVKNYRDNNICPNNEFNHFFNTFDENCEQINNNQLVKYMVTPYVDINDLKLLTFYNIENIDDLKKWIDENLNKKSFDNVNRIINLFIKSNFDNIKIYNKVLIEIIKNIIFYYFKNKEEIINKEIDSFFNYWIQKNDVKNFNINFILDFKKYLSDKYDK